MGTWDAGNFDNDAALDYVGGLVDRLTHTVNACFEEDNADLEEGGESELMPSVAIIHALSQHCGAAPPRPELVQSWRDRYLAIYDEQIDELDPDDDYKLQRRRVIETTFADLLDRAADFWSG